MSDCVADSNMTSHSYNEDTAERVARRIRLYYSTMNEIVGRLKPL